MLERSRSLLASRLPHASPVGASSCEDKGAERATAQPKENVLFWVMAPPKKTLEELKNEAITELERRGYDVRGKTPAQIRQMLRARPRKQNQMRIHQGRSLTGEKRG